MTETERIKTQIEKLTGVRSARLDDLMEALVTASRKDTVEDVVMDLNECGHDEAARIIKVNY